jgi:hypothetical protein
MQERAQPVGVWLLLACLLACLMIVGGAVINSKDMLFKSLPNNCIPQ